MWGLIKVLASMVIEHESRIQNMENDLTTAADQIHQFRMAFDQATTDVANKIQDLTNRLNAAIAGNDKVSAQQVMTEFQPALDTLKAMGSTSSTDVVTGPAGSSPVPAPTPTPTSSTGPTSTGASSNPATDTTNTTLAEGTTPAS